MQSETRRISEEEADQLDMKAEERLQELYPQLRRYCRFLSRNSSDWEDLAQEALSRAWQQYRHPSVLSSALLNTIAHNVWVDTVRKRSKESLEAETEQTGSDMHQTENRLEAVEQLIARLTPKQAVVFVLKEGFHYQLSEIADLLKTSEPAIKAVIHRTKQRLSKEETDATNPLIRQYWESDDHREIERLLRETFRVQDPGILITAAPFIRSLVKADTPVCSLETMHRSGSSSTTICMAA